METALGCGYSITDESDTTDFYSPPSSLDQGLFYPEDDEIESNTNYIASLSVEEINEDELKPFSLKLMSIETTPPSTPRTLNNTIMDFQQMKINTNLPEITTTNWSLNSPLYPKTPTNLLTPTSMDRYLLEHRHLSQSGHQGISVQHTEVTNETSRLYSYMTPVDRSSNSWSTFDDIKSPSCLNHSPYPRQMNSIYPNMNDQLNHLSSVQNPWFLSEILRQNNHQISLSTTAQQILNGNNRPLRSEKIDIEVIKHLIREANWKRHCGMKKEICVFCRNNGENELIYSSHSLKDPMGNVTCPILRAYQCPICGATGPQAHTIKYCQSTGDDNHRHIPTPYEKMLGMQTFGFDDHIPSSSIPSFLGQFSSPSSLYTNGWSDSYL